MKKIMFILCLFVSPAIAQAPSLRELLTEQAQCHAYRKFIGDPKKKTDQLGPNYAYNPPASVADRDDWVKTCEALDTIVEKAKQADQEEMRNQRRKAMIERSKQQ